MPAANRGESILLSPLRDADSCRPLGFSRTVERSFTLKTYYCCDMTMTNSGRAIIVNHGPCELFSKGSVSKKRFLGTLNIFFFQKLSIVSYTEYNSMRKPFAEYYR